MWRRWGYNPKLFSYFLTLGVTLINIEKYTLKTFIKWLICGL